MTGELFFIGIPGASLDDETRDLLTEVQPGGICLFARNIREAEQTRELLDEIRELLPMLPLLSIDQEGGLVDRLRRIMTPMPAASKLKTAADSTKLGSIIGETLRILGFNMDFAPVVDVIDHVRAEANNGLFSRTFGNSREEATELAGAFLSEMQKTGIIGCLKHFPGLGASKVDSHEDLPNLDVVESELNEVDLYPYRSLVSSNTVHAVMAAHAVFPASNLQETGQNGKLVPASLSRNFVTRLLREQLGFGGVVISDDLEMGAIIKNYGIGDACKMAVNAGVDMLAICADPANIREGFRSVSRAVESGEIDMKHVDGSLDRISQLRSRLAEPLPLDQARLTHLSGEIAELNSRLN